MASESIECLLVRTTKAPDVDSRIGYLYQQGVIKSPQARQPKPYIIPFVTTTATMRNYTGCKFSLVLTDHKSNIDTKNWWGNFPLNLTGHGTV